MVSSSKSGNEWKRINLAFGYNKTTNYKKRTYISGENNSTSMIDNFVSNAQGNTIDNLNSFTELLAWNTYLIDPLISNNNIIDGAYISNSSSDKKDQTKIYLLKKCIIQFMIIEILMVLLMGSIENFLN